LNAFFDFVAKGQNPVRLLKSVEVFLETNTFQPRLGVFFERKRKNAFILLSE